MYSGLKTRSRKGAALRICLTLYEMIGVDAPCQQTDAVRVVRILIKDAAELCGFQGCDEQVCTSGTAECHELHEQTVIRGLLFAAAESAFFAEIECFHRTIVT